VTRLRPLSGPVGLTYDVAPQHPPVDVGDLLLTRRGTAYLILQVRPVKRRQPLGPWRRLAVRCARLTSREQVAQAVAQGAAGHELVWYRRPAGTSVRRRR
jgi:hypothetical protein